MTSKDYRVPRVASQQPYVCCRFISKRGEQPQKAQPSKRSEGKPLARDDDTRSPLRGHSGHTHQSRPLLAGPEMDACRNHWSRLFTT